MSTTLLQIEVVVDRLTEFLFAAQVTLGRLNRCMSEQKLDLLKFSTSQVAQPRAGATPQDFRHIRRQ